MATALPAANGTDQYQSTSEKINLEATIGDVNDIISKLNAVKTQADLPAALSNVSGDVQDVKGHIQNAKAIAQVLSMSASTPQQQQDNQKTIADLQNLDNVVAALNAGIAEAQKSSPSIATMDAKLKEASDLMAKVNETENQAGIEKANADVTVGEVKDILARLNAVKAPADLPATLSNVSGEVQDIKVHIQNAKVIAQALNMSATTPQQQQDSLKAVADLQNLDNAVSALNAAIDEAGKSSPSIATMDAKLKEASDLLAKIN